jgi:hypothetical protein
MAMLNSQTVDWETDSLPVPVPDLRQAAVQRPARSQEAEVQLGVSRATFQYGVLENPSNGFNFPSYKLNYFNLCIYYII